MQGRWTWRFIYLSWMNHKYWQNKTFHYFYKYQLWHPSSVKPWSDATTQFWTLNCSHSQPISFRSSCRVNNRALQIIKQKSHMRKPFVFHYHRRNLKFITLSRIIFVRFFFFFFVWLNVHQLATTSYIHAIKLHSFSEFIRPNKNN